MAQVPTGSIISVANIDSNIDGFLLCDGSTVNKSNYPVLYDCFDFDNISINNGFNYGIVNESTFKVPNLINYFPCMDTNINNLGGIYGSNQIFLDNDNTPIHTHRIDYKISHSHVGTNGIINLNNNNWTDMTTYGEGIGGSHSDGPPYIIDTTTIQYESNNTTTSHTSKINIQLHNNTSNVNNYDITNSYIKISYYIKY